jgi:aerobic carbon-monoxide dehydrogenase small subunit
MTKHIINITVNGESYQPEVPARRLLADLLRDDLNLPGTKRGCETGVCGACSVLVNGEVVKSCLKLAVQVKGCNITTVEGLAEKGNGKLHVLQECFMTHGGLQCGYCTPGFLMTACDLLAHNPNPTEHEVRAGLSGNLCRCTGYNGIVDAILAAAKIINKTPAEAAHGH